MAEFQVLTWKGIPAQVRVANEGRRFSRQLPPRYQEEIDRVAMEQDLSGSDEYLNGWKWSKRQQRTGEPEQVLNSIVEELTNEWDLKLFGGPQK